MGNLTHLRRRLSEGVAAWLAYEFHCRRGELFSEKYIAHPIGALLATQLRGHVQAEYDHPILSERKKAGRKPQVDFAVFEHVEGYRHKTEDRKLITAVESKWLSRSEVSPADIAWDLLRLDLLARRYEIECYFVLAGLNKKLEALFASPDFQNLKRNGPMIPVASGVPRGNLIPKQGSSALIDKLSERKAKYPGVKFPEKVTVYAPHIYPPSAMNLTFSVYTWKIGEKKNENSFKFEVPH